MHKQMIEATIEEISIMKLARQMMNLRQMANFAQCHVLKEGYLKELHAINDRMDQWEVKMDAEMGNK